MPGPRLQARGFSVGGCSSGFPLRLDEAPVALWARLLPRLGVRLRARRGNYAQTAPSATPTLCCFWQGDNAPGNIYCLGSYKSDELNTNMAASYVRVPTLRHPTSLAGPGWTSASRVSRAVRPWPPLDRLM